MFERFTDDARSVVAQAQMHARRLGHRYIGCEHLLLAAASADEPASAVLREHGVTPDAVETEIVGLIGLGQAVGLFSAADQTALAAIGIDLDVVRARIEAAFGPDAFTRLVPEVRRSRWPGQRRDLMARLLRRRRRHGRRGETLPYATGCAYPTGHIPFTPRAKKSLQQSWREATALHGNDIGVEHLSLALLAMKDGAVPPILSALGVSQATVRTAILRRYRRAS